MYAVYFEKLGPRGRKSGSTRLSVEMPRRGLGREEERGGSDDDRESEKERKREAVILRVDLIGGIPAEEIPLITERQAGTYPRPVARTRGGGAGVTGARGMRVLHESVYIYYTHRSASHPARCAYTRLCLYLVDARDTRAYTRGCEPDDDDDDVDASEAVCSSHYERKIASFVKKKRKKKEDKKYSRRMIKSINVLRSRSIRDIHQSVFYIKSINSIYNIKNAS